MRVRIKDVAERAGVSTTMVSLYLNHHPLSARMAEKTKQRIDEAVRELNYQPSATARSLKKGKSKTLGLVIGEIAGVNSSFYSQMLLEEAEKYDYQLLISLTRYSREQELKCLQNLFSRQVLPPGDVGEDGGAVGVSGVSAQLSDTADALPESGVQFVHGELPGGDAEAVCRAWRTGNPARADRS